MVRTNPNCSASPFRQHEQMARYKSAESTGGVAEIWMGYQEAERFTSDVVQGGLAGLHFRFSRPSGDWAANDGPHCQANWAEER